MDVRRLLLLLAVLTTLCGCVRTYRSEYHQTTTTTVGTNGSATVESSGMESAHQYRGPALPSRASGQ